MLHLPPLNYACLHCGKSCEMFEVDVDPARLVPGVEKRPDGRLFLRCTPSGCPNLGAQAENRCQVYDKRPSACGDFPFQATETPGGRYIGVSFACTAVLQKHGPSLTENQRDWQQLPARAAQAVDLVEGKACEWELYLQIEEYLSELLSSPDACFRGAIAVSISAVRDDFSSLGKLELGGLSPQLELACQRSLRGLLVLCEGDNSQHRAQEVLTAQLQGGSYQSLIFQGTAEPLRIQEKMDLGDPEHWPQVAPFFRHLLFRKFLWGAPSVQARICVLPLLNEMLRYWTWQQALTADQSPTQAMRLEAIREVERRLTFHARGWEDLLSPLGLAFLQGVW